MKSISTKTPAFLVSNLTNIRYLTGMKLSFGLALIKAKKVTLYVDSRYTEAAKKPAKRGVTVKPIEDLPKDMKRVRTCGFEADEVTVARLAHWKRKFKNTKFVQCTGVIEEYRRSKTPEEIKHFKKAQSITKKIMKRIPSALKSGITEKELAEQIRRWAVDLAADELSFDPIVAFGKNSASPHHHPTTTKLKKRDIVQIDCGARVSGYCADRSEVFFVGEPMKEWVRVYEVVERAKKEAIKVIKEAKESKEAKDSITNHDLDAIAREVLRAEGLEEYFVHSLGHGVGLDIHEGPSISIKAPKVKLLKNEIITIEPGVYIPGKFGVRLEEEVVI